MTKDEALKLALEALTYIYTETTADEDELIDQAITAIKEALAQLEQEPVAWMSEHRFDELRKGFPVMTTLTKQRAFEDDVAFYTTPPQRTWVGLTDDEILEVWKENEKVYTMDRSRLLDRTRACIRKAQEK
jgi:hypothetical protein